MVLDQSLVLYFLKENTVLQFDCYFILFELTFSMILFLQSDWFIKMTISKCTLQEGTSEQYILKQYSHNSAVELPVFRLNYDHVETIMV